MSEVLHKHPQTTCADLHTCNSFLQATALRNALQKLTAANKSTEGTLYQGLAFLLPLGLPLLVFRSVSSVHCALYQAPSHVRENIWACLMHPQARLAADACQRRNCSLCLVQP